MSTESDKTVDKPLYTPAPGERQFTVRAVLTGCMLGGVVCAMNIYFGLQTGWSIGGSLIAAILGFTFFRGIATLSGTEPLSRLEVNIAQTAGSAAGSMTSAAGLLAPIPALRILGQDPLSRGELTLWAASVAFLGVFFAVPLRRQMVLVERLRFPTGTATANTILSMFAEGREAVQKSQYLLIFAGLAALFTLTNHFVPEIAHPIESTLKALTPEGGAPPEALFPIVWLAGFTVVLYNSPLMWGAGILIGPRVAVSLLVGALIAWLVLAPGVEALGWTDATKTMSYEHGARGWILWPGVAIMVADALTSLALSWRTILNTFTGTTDGSEAADTSDDAIPNAWWMGGLALATIGTVAASWYLFEINPLMTILAVGLSSILAAIAVRSTGETDINPIGGMGKVTQLVYGGIAPGSVTTNLMTAAVTGSGASQAGDMMQDLKTGWLLGASPRKQMLAQMLGITVGIFVCVPIYLLFDAAWDIGGVDPVGAFEVKRKVMPAPAAHAWAGMARVLSQGLQALPHNAKYAVAAGLGVGILLPILKKVFDNPVWLPSGLAMGVAFIVPAYYSIAMFLGMVAFQVWRANDKSSADALGFAVASGLVAGEGLMGIVNAVLQVMGFDSAWLRGG